MALFVVVNDEQEKKNGEKHLRFNSLILSLCRSFFLAASLISESILTIFCGHCDELATHP